MTGPNADFDIAEKTIEISDSIKLYTKESFCCFFSDLLRHHPEKIPDDVSFSFQIKI